MSDLQPDDWLEQVEAGGGYIVDGAEWKHVHDRLAAADALLARCEDEAREARAVIESRSYQEHGRAICGECHQAMTAHKPSCWCGTVATSLQKLLRDLAAHKEGR